MIESLSDRSYIGDAGKRPSGACRQLQETYPLIAGVVPLMNLGRHTFHIALSILALVRVSAMAAEQGHVDSGPIAVVKRMDVNRDGVLEPDEIPPGAKSFVASVARDAGLELGQPIRLQALRAPTKSANHSAQRPTRSHSGPANRSRAMRYAASLIALYDQDDSGGLDREELAPLQGKWHRADKNSDGFLNQRELADELYSYRRHPAGERSWRYGDYNPLTDDATGKRRYRRFRTARERLPAGLPDWFVDRDQDQDGQVKMFEFADVWTDQKLVEFSDLDANGDGVITPREMLSNASRD